MPSARAYKSGPQDDELGLAGAAIGRVHNPPSRFLVKMGPYNDGVEGAVFLDVQDLVDMVEVRSDLLVVRICRRPVEVFPHFWPAELVLGDGRVNTSTRVAVETPGASQVVASLEDNGLEAPFPERFEREDTAWCAHRVSPCSTNVVPCGQLILEYVLKPPPTIMASTSRLSAYGPVVLSCRTE